MDDCSSDDTVSIVEEFKNKDERIKFYRSENRCGISAQMNKGISLAEGKYICRMDSDDVAHPERLYEQKSFLDRFHRIKLCTTDYRIFFGEDIFTSRFVRNPVNCEAIRVALLKDLPVCGPSFFACRDLFTSFSFDENLTVGEDYDLFSRIILQHEISNLPKPLYYYRKHGNSVTDDLENWRNAKIDLIRSQYLKATGVCLDNSELNFFFGFCKRNIQL
jgi:glycosyltransferase involved in cell wall biosynthesis